MLTCKAQEQETPDEVKIASYNVEGFSYNFSLNDIKSIVENALEQELGITATIDSLIISDPEPTNE